MVRQLTATVSSRGQVSIPAEVRRHLGLKPQDKVTFTIDGDEVRIAPGEYTWETVRGSVKPWPGLKSGTDFEEEIREAMEDRADEIMRRMREG